MRIYKEAGKKEREFFGVLKDVFVGAKVEGESGFVNLMRIKSRYYEKGVFPRLKEDIDKALEPFPEFREELFDRLYTFFRRYFSESGSIYFRFTPPHEHVYEKVYTNDRDVVLFWKTHMLYYVKTDRLFRSMAVEVDGFRFFFDVSTLEHKKANEKRSLVYNFKERREDGTLVLSVAYSERGTRHRFPRRKLWNAPSAFLSAKARWTSSSTRTPASSCGSNSTCGSISMCLNQRSVRAPSGLKSASGNCKS